MGFYTSPSFFAMLAVAVVPAAVLGLLGRSIRGYGMLASVVFLAFLFAGSPAELAAFALFRFFDILKPLGIRKMEKLPGGYGIMADDILSGIYGMIVIFIFRLLV